MHRFALALSLSLLACGPDVKPGLGVEVTVGDPARTDGRVSRLVVAFDHAMVDRRQVGKPLKYVDRVPFRLQPKIDGKLSWLEDRKLVFHPAEPLPRSTGFTVTVPRGTRARDGFGLVEDFTHAFETERLTLRTQLQRNWQLPAPKRWASGDQPLMLSFNQPVETTAIAKHCAYRAKGVVVPARVQSQTPEGAAATHFVVAPADALPTDTLWMFDCAEALSSTEGPLGLQSGARPDHDDALLPQLEGQAPGGRIAFRTFGPMGVASVSPAGRDVDPDTAHVEVHFHNPPVIDGKPPAVTITPAPQDMRVLSHVEGRALSVAVQGLQPRTEYTVTVAAGVSDAFGQRSGAAHTHTFRTGAMEPGLSLESGSWSVESQRGRYIGWARNVATISVTAAALTPTQLFDLLPKLRWWNEQAVDLGQLGIAAQQHEVPWTGEVNHWGQFELSPQRFLGEAAGKTRFYYFAASAAEVLDYRGDRARVNEVLLNVTNLGLSTKLASGDGLAWVTRLHDGQPQPGAKVLVRARTGQVLWQGKTDAQGLARMPGSAALRKKIRGPKSAPLEDEERQGGDGHDRLLVFAQLGDDMTFVDPEQNGGLSPWNFGHPADFSSATERLRGFVHTDRGLYRPGDTVQMRGLLRKMKLSQGLSQPTARSLHVHVRDPKGERILSQELKLSRYGSWHLSLPIGEGAALGDYRIESATADGSFFETFTVEEYRPAAFEVKTRRAAERPVHAGDELSIGVDGRYFYGAPVRGGTVKWRVHTRSRDVRFPQYRDFVFGDERNYYRGHDPYGVESFVTEAEQTLDTDGKSKLQLPLPEASFATPSTLMISATVQDESNQSISSNLTLPVHSSRYYLGIDSGGWMLRAKQKHTIRLTAVNAAGKQIAARPRLRLIRHRWSCAWERWGYSGSYRCDSSDEELLDKRVSLPKGGALDYAIEVPEAGEYFVVLQGNDRLGNPVVASTELWAWGDGDDPWRVDDSGRFEVVADKQAYQAGDVAKLLVKAPLQGATALLTIEREGVLSSRLLTDLKAGEAVEVPIEEGFAPNAYVSVMLARGRSGDGARGLPSVTMGVANLEVSHADRRLKVEVRTDRQDYRPGEQVKATVAVTDAEGKPVRAELSLAAADEGVLSLIGFATPDPLAHFYAQWGLGVRSATRYDRLAHVPGADAERYISGGDSAGRPGTLRSRFRATAYWNPAVETNAQGLAEVSFEAPDNLTAFRLMAVAADVGDRFGSGDRRFVVNKKLQLLDALPRFANVGDRFEAAVVVANETGVAGSVKVRMQAQGLTVEGESTRTVAVAAGGRTRVSFSVRVEAPGQARVRFFAEMGAERDGYEKSIPLRYPSSEESALVAQGRTEGEARFTPELPAGVLAGTAYLELSVDPDGLAGIEESLRDLIRYPYGCLEQTTSRLIPLVSVQEIFRTLELSDFDGDKLERYVRIAIAKIARHQTPSGGFSLWPGGQPEVYLTAFALWGLHQSREAGHGVRQAVIDDGLAYLRRTLGRPLRSDSHYSMGGELSDRAFALHVMNLLGKPEPSAVEALVARVGELPFYGKALLARSLAATVGAGDLQVTDLLDGVLAGAQVKGALALVHEPQPLSWYMSSNVRSTAIVADALIELRPDDPMLAKLVAGLLQARRHSGTWRTTQENLFALTALTRYVKSSAGRPSAVHVQRGDDTLLQTKLDVRGNGRLRHLSIPLDASGAQVVSVRADEGAVHYMARLRYRRDAAHQPALSEGFALSHAFTDAETGAALQRATEGQLVRVTVSLSAPATREHVAVSDYLPAGLEAVNGKFKTSAEAVPDPNDRYGRWWISHQELRDERVSAFANHLYHRPRSFSYLARATTPGSFVLPSATIESMYEPQLRARTALGRFEVVAR